MSLPEILAMREETASGFRTTIPDEWLQGRTAYGGLSAALAYEGAKAADVDLPPLRSAQVSFIGPLSGEVEISARLMRRGRNAAFVAAEVSGEKGVGTSAMFVFMSEIDSHVSHSEGGPPQVAPPQPLAEGTAPLGSAPGFIRNFDMTGFESFEAQGAADVVRWFRLKDRRGIDPMTELVLIGDGLPPAAMTLMRERVNISSLTWLYNVLAPPETSDGWWLLRAESDHAEHGASSQDMSVWNADGDLVARGMQSVALFG